MSRLRGRSDDVINTRVTSYTFIGVRTADENDPTHHSFVACITTLGTALMYNSLYKNTLAGRNAASWKLKQTK